MYFLITFLILILPNLNNCFNNIDKLNITTQSRGHGNFYCSIARNIEINQVTCDDCKFIRSNGAYELTTQNLQSVILYTVDKSRIIKVPVTVNCEDGKVNSNLKYNFMTESFSNEISIKIDATITNGFVVIFTDRYKSFFKTVKTSLKEYKFSELIENEEYQICLSVFEDNLENKNYQCQQIKTKPREQSNTCKKPPNLNYLNSNLVANSLVRVKWDFHSIENCPISQLQIKLSDKLSNVCLQKIIIRNETAKIRFKRHRNTDNFCSVVRTINSFQLKSGKFDQYWSEPTVYAEMNVVTSDGAEYKMLETYKVDINENSNYIQEANVTTTGACYQDCILPNNTYNGIRSVSKDGKICFKWSKMTTIKTYKVKSNYCFNDNVSSTKIVCPDDKTNFKPCNIPKCTVDQNETYSCISMVNSSSTFNSLSGNYTANNSYMGFIVLLHNKSGDCLEYILYGPHEKHKLANQVQGFILSCDKERYQLKIDNQFNFSCLESNTKYTIYVIPIISERKVGDVFYYSQKTKPLNIPKFEKLEGKFVANNTVSIKWNITELNKNEIAAVILKLYENQLSNCTRKIIISRNQSDNKCGYQYESQNDSCYNKEMIMERDNFINGQLFRYWNKSSLFIQLIVVNRDQTKHVKNITHIVRKNKGIDTCFFDCFIQGKYNKLHSGDRFGKKCKSNINNCNISECDLVGRGITKFHQCPEVSSNSSTNTSLFGTWNHKTDVQEFIVLLHNANSECISYTLYNKWKPSHLVRNLIMSSDLVRNYIKSCKTVQKQVSRSELSYKFTNLKPNSMYTIYIIPIVDKYNIGIVKVIEEITIFITPSLITNVHLNTVSISTMHARWNKTWFSLHNGPIEYYMIKLEPGNRSIKTIYNSYIFKNLKKCAEYCMSIKAFKGGRVSGISKTICNQTKLSDLGSITLNPIKNNSNSISWKFTWDYCLVTYKVIIWTRNNKKYCQKHYITNMTNFKLPKLDSQTPFSIQVEAYLPNNRKTGETKLLSNIQSYFRGNKTNIYQIGKFKSKFDPKKKLFDFKYEINKHSKLIYQYDIVFRNQQSNFCYRRYIITNDCVYKSNCTKNNVTLDFKKNTVGKNGEDCLLKYTKYLCIYDAIKFKFIDENMKNIRVDLSGRTYEGWSFIGSIKVEKGLDEIKNFEIMMKQSDKMFIIWDKLMTTCYYKSAIRYNVSMIQNNVETFGITHENFHLLEKLKPCTKYCVAVTALTDLEKSKTSKSICAVTLMQGINDLRLFNHWRSAIVVSWGILPQNCESCSISNYEILITGFQFKASMKTTQTHYTIRNLLPKTNYCVRVRVISKFNKSNLSTKKCVTTLE